MKKYVMTNTGKPVKVGDRLIAMNSSLPKSLRVIEITENSILSFIKHGIIKEIEEEQVPISYDILIDHVSKRVKWNKDNTTKYLENLGAISEAAVFTILLREFAIILDKKYSDHIERSKEIYILSTADGEIHKMRELHKIKNFRNFAAFRNLEDAMYAKEFFKPLLTEMFNKK